MKKILFSSFIVLLLIVNSGCKKNSKDSSNGTCSDKILNQDETAVDCGGKCSPCPSCSDGIQNQGETDVDCGGPCAQCKLSYPDYGYYGRNILKNDTLKIVADNGTFPYYYSMMADVPPKSSLKVIIKNLTTDGFPTYSAGSHVGWNFVSWSTSYQEYVVNFPVKADLSILFMNHGSALVEIYENGAAVATRTKTIAW